MIDTVLSALRSRSAGGWKRHVFFAAVAVLFFVVELSGFYDSGMGGVSHQAAILLAAGMGAAVALSGFFPLVGGLLFVLLAVFEIFLGTGVTFSYLGFYLVMADWIFRRWYVAAVAALVVVDGMSIVAAQSLQGAIVDVVIFWTFALVLGLAMRFYYDSLAAAELRTELARRELAEAEERINEENRTLLHDTAARDLVQIVKLNAPEENATLGLSDRQIQEKTYALAIKSLGNLREGMSRKPTSPSEQDLSQVVHKCQETLRPYRIELVADVPAEIAEQLTTDQNNAVALLILEGTHNILKYAPAGCEARLTLAKTGERQATLTMENPVSQARTTTDKERRAMSSSLGLESIAAKVALVDAQVRYGEYQGRWRLAADIALAKTREDSSGRKETP